MVETTPNADGQTPNAAEPQGQTLTHPNGQTPNGQSQTQQQNQKTELTALPADVQEYIKTLRTEAEKNRKAAEKVQKDAEVAEQAKLLEDKKFQELAEKLQGQVKDLETKLAGKDREALIARIAAKHKLSENMARRLVGQTEAELESDAAELAKEAAPPKAPNTEAGSKGQTPASPAKAGEGKQGNQENPQRYRFQTPGEVAW